MGHSQYDDARRERAAWNAGKKVGTKRPLTQKQIWAVRFFLDREGRIRDRALFDLAIDSKLRGCDLIKIRIHDLVARPEIRIRAIVVQKRRVVQSSLRSPETSEPAFWLGLKGVGARSTTMYSRAGSITPTT
jgi:hypothetical protein